MNYAQYIRATTPQSEPVAGKNMSANNAGGYAFKIDKWTQLDRFLVLGTEKGTYYVSERKLTQTNFAALDECLAEDAIRVIDRAVEISTSGRAPKNDAALFVLAKAAADKKYRFNRQYALKKLPLVARTGTHLFHFVAYVNELRGWGRALKKGVADWYNEKSATQLAYQLVKYKQRDRWSHRDLLRLAHPKASTPAHNILYKKVSHPEIALEATDDKAITLYSAADYLSTATNPQRVASLIREFNLPRECVNTQLLNDRKVWEALLEKMPMTALIRNLGKLSSMGMTERYGADAQKIAQQLVNKEALKKARIHPITVLAALNIYKQGGGHLGNLTWQPNLEIIEALNDAFYETFNNIESTGKRYLLGLDISGSMFGNSVAGIAGLDAAMASAAMAMVTLRSEKNAMIKAFTCGDRTSYWNTSRTGQLENALRGFVDVNISKRSMLDDVIGEMRRLSGQMGGTDCALPMVWATKNQVPVDAFVVYTDSETWAGYVHPFEALKDYRERMGIPAKLIVVAASANDVTIADPSDPGMLDVAGFDSAVPNVIADFAKAKID